MTEDRQQQKGRHEDLSNLERWFSALKNTSVEKFDEHCDAGSYTLKYHLLDHMVNDILIFGMQSALGSKPYEHFNAHIRQAYKRALQ